jgi:hypothetical protein
MPSATFEMVRGLGENRGHIDVRKLDDWESRPAAAEPQMSCLSRRWETTMAIQQRSCKRCGEKISEKRLAVLPNTRLCLECSQEIGGDFNTPYPSIPASPAASKGTTSWKVVESGRSPQDAK